MLWIRLVPTSIAVCALVVVATGIAGPGGSGGPSFPAGCAPKEVAGFVLRFLDAYNAGATAEADRFFAPTTSEDLIEDAKDGELGFRWYSVSGSIGQRIDGEARNRATLSAYFAERHHQGERLDLFAISLNYRTWLAHGVGFVFLLRRTASDLPRLGRGKFGLTLGKGGINCVSQTIHVWSAGRYFTTTLTRRTQRRISPCQAPRRWRPVAGRPLVCVSQRP
jgi:hypothetical protein